MAAILCCVSREEEADSVLTEAVRLSQEMEAPLSVVIIHPTHQHDHSLSHPCAWHLRTDAPLEPLRRFAIRNKITHIVFGPDGWRRWGEDLSASLEAARAK